MKPIAVTNSQWFKANMYYLGEYFLGLKKSEKHLRPLKEKLYKEVLENKEFLSRGKFLDTKDIEFDSFESFQKSKMNLMDSPLIFRGVAKEWDCTKKWSKEFFRDYFATTEVAMIDTPGLVDPTKENKYKQTTFAEYFKEAEIDKSKYLRFSRVLDHNPSLLKDINLDWLRQFKGPTSLHEITYLFIGEGDTKTPMHAGLPHTLFIQIKGRKKWTILAPNERFCIDPISDRTIYFYTNGNIHDDNDPKYPLMPYARRWEFVLEDGDVMWMPGLFWHHVENLTPTIGVAYKYQNLLEQFKISKFMFMMPFMSTKPSIFTSFFYNIMNKKDHLFNHR
jgi:hypothetical protein